MGLRTTTNEKYYTTSAKFTPFSNKGKTLVIQYIVKNEQLIDCGGSYLKLYPSGVDQETLGGETDYNIMFGPDICGSSNRRVHVILSHKGKGHLIKKTIAPETDEFSHLYTLIINPDNTYEVRIDGKKKEGGSISDDWDILPPKKIKDPKESKPADWVDAKEIADPEDVKPADWDDIPATIVDPDAEKPEDWNDELDGEWEAPVISNPEFKGEWKAKKIPNPEYVGPWVHPMIDNPDFEDDPELYAYDDFGVVGIEVWQVKAGTIFDDFLIASSEEEAAPFVAAFEARLAAEKVNKAKIDEEAAAAAKEAAANSQDIHIENVDDSDEL